MGRRHGAPAGQPGGGGDGCLARGAGDFALSANQVLTITAGQTSSTGTVTITAEDHDIDAPAKELTVSAAVTSGPTGLAAPASQTLTITDDETAPSAERNGDADGVGDGCLARGGRATSR